METAAMNRIDENILTEVREGAFDKAKVMMVPYDKLSCSSLNKFAIEDMEELKASIETLGLLTPLSIVGPNEDGKYEILSGERRYRAIGALREDSTGVFDGVPCLIVGTCDMHNDEKELLIEVANIESRDIKNKDAHRFKIVKLLQSLEGNEAIRQRGYAKKLTSLLGVSERYANMIKTIYVDGTDELKDAMLDENVKTRVVEAGKIAKLPVEHQKAYVDMVKGGETSWDAYDKIKDKIAEDNNKEAEVRESVLSGKILEKNAKSDADAFFDSFGRDDSGVDDYGFGEYSDMLDAGDVLKWVQSVMFHDSLTPEEQKVYEACRQWVESREA
jgi:hypothetical protein